MGGDNRARKRSLAASSDSQPVSKKAKAEQSNDEKTNKKHGKIAVKKGVVKSKSMSYESKDVNKPLKKLSPQNGKSYSGKVVSNGPIEFDYYG